VARAIEARAGDRLNEQSALLAYHWDTAKDPARAIEWHQRAAEWCELTDATGGLGHWERVSELVSELPEDKDMLVLGALACSRIIGFLWRLGGERDDVEAILERGKALAEKAGDKSVLAGITGAYGAYRGVTLGYCGDYCAYALEALHQAELTDDEELKFACKYGYLSAAYTLNGQWTKAAEIVESTPDLLERDDLYGAAHVSGSPRLIALFDAGLALFVTGRPTEARELLARLDTATAIKGSQDVGIFGLYESFMAEILYGNWDSAMAAAQHIVAQLEDVQTSMASTFANLAMGIALYAKGSADEAVPFLQNCIATFNEKSTGGFLIGGAMGDLAEAELDLGHSDDGLKYAVAAVDFCIERDQKFDLQPWLALVRARVLCGDEAGAQAAIDQAQRVITQTGAVVYQPLLHERRADFAEAFESNWTASDELSEALRLYEDLGADGHVRRVRARLQ
jgi:hypothetical protein